MFGFFTVQEQERALIERWGEYKRTEGPGLHWLIPFVERIRASISIWQTQVPLFEKQIEIDFTDGSATPQETEAWVRIKSPEEDYDAGDGEEFTGTYRAIYKIANWRRRITALLENALRSYLNSISIDEALIAKGAGFDLRNKLPGDEVEKIEKAMSTIGFELISVTIKDFDLTSAVIASRESIHTAQKRAIAAENEGLVRAREVMGTFIKMLAESMGKTPEEIRQEIESSQEMRKMVTEFAEEMVSRRLSIDGKALADIRTAGGGDLEQIFMRLITALRGGTMGKND